MLKSIFWSIWLDSFAWLSPTITWKQKIYVHCQRQKCSPETVVSGDI